jgi:hypothetical protein
VWPWNCAGVWASSDPGPLAQPDSHHRAQSANLNKLDLPNRDRGDDGGDGDDGGGGVSEHDDGDDGGTRLARRFVLTELPHWPGHAQAVHHRLSTPAVHLESD